MRNNSGLLILMKFCLIQNFFLTDPLSKLLIQNNDKTVKYHLTVIDC